MDLFRNGTDKTGTGQVPFIPQILSEPFVFLSEPFQFWNTDLVPPMPGGNLFLSALHGGIACESRIKKDTRKNITKNIAREDRQ